MVEETGLDYELHPVAIGKGEQKRPEYLAINPNGKIPAIVDRDGPLGRPITVFESGAALLYLADLGAFPNVRRWREAIAARPAVRRGLALVSQQ